MVRIEHPQKISGVEWRAVTPNTHQMVVKLNKSFLSSGKFFSFLFLRILRAIYFHKALNIALNIVNFPAYFRLPTPS